MTSYCSGALSLEDFYAQLQLTYFPVLQSGEDRKVMTDCMSHILHLIADPERKSALHLRHLRSRPRFFTPCCAKEHCFRCKTKDYHTGRSCEVVNIFKLRILFIENPSYLPIIGVYVVNMMTS